MKKKVLLPFLLVGFLVGCSNEPGSTAKSSKSSSDIQTSVSSEQSVSESQSTTSSVEASSNEQTPLGSSASNPESNSQNSNPELSSQNSSPSSSVTSSEKVTVYHTVTFDPNNGKPAFHQQVEDGEIVVKPIDPEKTGHTFTGWVESSSEQTWYFQSNPVTKDITLSAKYSINKYTIAFNTKGGSKINSIRQDYDTDITAPENPTREGYEFVGWDAEIPEKMPANNMVINAIWSANEYTITFNSDGGTYVAPITQDCGTRITAPAAPTREGYTFTGWDQDLPSTMPAGGATLTATWEINKYTITFEDGFGNTVSTMTKDFGAEIDEVISNPTNEYYDFVAWDQAIPETMPSRNITIKAKWSSSDFTFMGGRLDSYQGSSTTVVIPSYTPTGQSVVSVGASAFANNTTITSVTIPSGVTTIGNYAFKGCTNLETVTISEGIISIGCGTFYSCTHLDSITLPETLTSIGDHAFYDCESLTSIDLPETLTSIGSNAFKNCVGLTNIVIPSGITSIGNYTFSNCAFLESVTIPDSVTTIGNYAFNECCYLASIVIPDSVTSIGDYAFNDCYHLKTVALSKTLLSLGNGAFRECCNLEFIMIPDSVTSIGTYVFYDCNKVKIYCEAESKPMTWSETWNGSYNSEVWAAAVQDEFLYYIKDGEVNIVKYLGEGCDVAIPETLGGITVTSINFGVSYGVSNLNITLPSTITTIGENAFYGNGRLASISIPSSVTSIESSAFQGCSLTSIEIPGSVESFGYSVFANCGSLASVVISSGFTSLTSFAFMSDSALTSVTLPDTLTYIQYWSFKDCTSLESIVIPSSVTTMSGSVFEGCTNLHIYCEAESKPEGWRDNWNISNCPVTWGYTPAE